MASTGKPPESTEARGHEERAAEAFLRRRAGHWSASDEAAFEAQCTNDPALADAAQRVERAWQAVGDHATSPELMAIREQALTRARRAAARRWLSSDGRARGGRVWLAAAAVAGIAVTLGIALQLSPHAILPGLHQTGIGEQHVIELDDRSRIALDARTRLRVRFSDDARIVQLMEGQAQFFVAKDPVRPFRVEAGEHTIVAVGTVFTVEYVGHEVHVAMLEGKVAVLLPPAGSLPSITVPSPRLELTAGEEYRIREDGSAKVTQNADLDAAVAWRQGKVIFDAEPLGEAVRRLNRYSRLQLEIEDASLAGMRVSGVFEAGDTQAFAEAVQSYLPVTADYSHRGVVRLQPK